MSIEDISNNSESPMIQPNRPITPVKKASKHASKLVLAIEFCERVCYYSISANLLLFCIVMMDIGKIDSILLVLIFTGWSYFFSLFANWIADSFSGKYYAIAVSLGLYSAGISLVVTVAYYTDNQLHYRLLLLMVAVVLMSFGAGTIKSNISTFGARQVAEYGEKTIQCFFNWFYWLINIAAFLAFTVIAYLQIESFFYGFIPALSTILIATLIILLGKTRFNCKKPIGSHFSDIVQIIKHAIYRKWKFYETIQSEVPEDTSLDLLDYAHVLFGGFYSTDQIDTVRSIGRVILVFLTMIIYWCVYFQMSSVFLLQSQYFKLTINDFHIPAASMNLFDSVSLFLLIQFMEVCVYPLCNHYNLNISTLRRMGIGLLLTVFSMVIAGFVETQRKNNITGNTTNIIHETAFNSSDNIVFWQAPQFILIGFSEVLTSISGLEFAYSQSPKALQGVVLSLFLATSGCGAFLASIIVKIVSSYTNWLCEEINECKLEYYFFLLAGLSFLNFLIFTGIAVNYSYVINYAASVQPGNSPHPPDFSRGISTPNLTEDWIEDISSRVDLSRPASPTSISTITQGTM